MRVSKRPENAPVEKSSKFSGKEKAKYVKFNSCCYGWDLCLIKLVTSWSAAPEIGFSVLLAQGLLPAPVVSCEEDLRDRLWAGFIQVTSRMENV